MQRLTWYADKQSDPFLFCFGKVCPGDIFKRLVSVDSCLLAGVAIFT